MWLLSIARWVSDHGVSSVYATQTVVALPPPYNASCLAPSVVLLCVLLQPMVTDFYLAFHAVLPESHRKVYFQKPETRMPRFCHQCGVRTHIMASSDAITITGGNINTWKYLLHLLTNAAAWRASVTFQKDNTGQIPGSEKYLPL